MDICMGIQLFQTCKKAIDRLWKSINKDKLMRRQFGVVFFFVCLSPK